MSKKHLFETIILIVCISLLSSFSIPTMAATTTKDVTSQVLNIGNPFTKAKTYARNVWDMQVYNGRIYLGHGDYINNASPIPVIYYDPTSNKFITQYTVNEEQIDKYKVLNGKLYIPGTDARESWDYGNFYTLDNDQWTKFRTIPKANHVFDMTYFNGQLYAAIGATTRDACGLVASKDMGKTWTTVQNTFSSLNDWLDNLFVVNNKLYATGDLIVAPTVSPYTKFRNFLTTDGIKPVVQPYSNSFLPGATLYHNYNMIRSTTINNSLVYLGVSVSGINDQWSPDAMYVATDVGHVRRVVFPTANALPTDIVVRDNTTYVSAYVKNSSNSYTNYVFKSDDLQTWTELFKFNTDTFVRSFEELNGDFYFGLGCDMTTLTPSTGNILKVAKTAYQTPVPAPTPTTTPATVTAPTTATTATTAATVPVPAPNPIPIIIDNTDSDFTSNSTWTISTATSGYYGANYLNDGSSDGDISKWAKWTPNLPESGNYNLYMRWTSGTDRPLAAPLEIKYYGGTDTNKTVNQQKDNGTWVLIGTYNMSAGTDNYVKILCSCPGYTIADAVKFEKVTTK